VRLDKAPHFFKEEGAMTVVLIPQQLQDQVAAFLGQGCGGLKPVL